MLALMSGLYLSGPGRQRARFERALTLLEWEHGDADALVLLGDLADTGQPEDYRWLQTRLRRCPFPVFCAIGTHDDRNAFHGVFGGDGFVEGPVSLGDMGRGYLLDTCACSVGKHGSLDHGRLERLGRYLAASSEPLMLFLHHPPILTGAPAFDMAGLEHRMVLESCLRAHPGKVRAVFFGHCHMPVSGTVGGVPAYGMPALSGQSAPVFVERQLRHNPALPPGYGLVLTYGADVTVHALTLPEAGLDDRCSAQPA